MIQQLRYEGERLDDVLARIHDDHGDDANIVTAEMVRSGGIGGFFARETYEVTVELPREGAGAVAVTEPEVDADDAFEPVIDEPRIVTGRDFADVLSAMIDDRVELTETARGLRRPTILETRDPIDAFDAINSFDSFEPQALKAPVLPVVTSALAASGSIDLTSSVDDGPPSGPIGIAEMFDVVASSLRTAPGVPGDGVVAVIGARGDAVEVAIGVAQRLGRPASDVLLVAPSDGDAASQSLSPESMAEIVRAAADRRRASGSAGPTIAVVVVAPGVAGHRWATNVLAELRADQSRLAVAAWRPLDRLAETIVGLGGVDVVDIVDFESAEHPEDLLGIDAAIGTIDGVEATPTQWVAALAAAGRSISAGIGRSSMDAR